MSVCGRGRSGLRRAGVSSFGISGTNCPRHPRTARAGHRVGTRERQTGRRHPSGVQPWVLSARTEEALRAQAARLADFLTDAPADVRDVALSLATQRTLFDHRAVVLGADLETALTSLRALAAGAPDAAVAEGVAGNGRTAFLFSGQGSQRLGMGRDLYERFPVFAEAFDAVCAELDEHLDRPLREVVWGEDTELLNRTAYAQPGLFAVEVALFRLVESWGVRPEFVAGHSIGEVAAAHVAGVFTLADACRARRCPWPPDAGAARGRRHGGGRGHVRRGTAAPHRRPVHRRRQRPVVGGRLGLRSLRRVGRRGLPGARAAGSAGCASRTPSTPR